MSLIGQIHITMHNFPKYYISVREDIENIAIFAKQICRIIGSAQNLYYVEVNEKCETLESYDSGGIDDVLAALLVSKVPRIDLSLAANVQQFLSSDNGLGEKQLSYLTISASELLPNFVMESLRFFPYLTTLTIRPSSFVFAIILDNINWREILSNPS